MNKLLLSLALFLLAFSTNAQEEYEVIRQNETSKHELDIDKFYFVHHTFADSFFMTNLYKQLNYDEMTSILKEVYDGVTETQKVNVQFKIDKDLSDARIAYFFKEHEENGKMFIMLTNFDNSIRKFAPEPDPKNQLARWYFIKKGKMVYRKDKYTKEEEAKKKQGETFEIIDYYMFDDNFKNDKLVKPLIDKLLSSSDESSINKLYGYLYLSEYHLLNNNLESAEKAIKDLSNLFETSTDIPKGYSLIVDMAKAEYAIFKRF